MANMETRSGLKPVNSGNLPFEITTDNVEEFLQGKFDAIMRQKRSNGEHVDDIKVTLMSIQISKIFVPFMILLPTSVLKSQGNGRNKGRNDEDEASIFNPDNSSGRIYIQEEIFQQLQIYGYTSDDARAFFSREWKNALGVDASGSEFLRYNRIPRVQALNRGKDQFVTCILDPIRLFYSMLEDPNHQSPFRIDIDKSTKIAGGVYKYFITRVPLSGKNKKKGFGNNKERFAFELQNRLKR